MSGGAIVGILRGLTPWYQPPPRTGKLLSAGVTARNLCRALSLRGPVVGFEAPAPEGGEESGRASLERFLRSIEVLWASVYPGDAHAIRIRHELDLPCRIILNACGAMPKAAEAMLLPWQQWLRPGDGILFNCEADRAIWQRIAHRSVLREWVVPLPVDEGEFCPRPLEERGEIRDRLDIPRDAALLLYVGRINIQKNLHGLLRLLAAVRQKAPDTYLCVVGAEDNIILGEFGVPNTGYGASLRHLADELQIADAIRWPGLLFGKDLADVYAAADVLVHCGFYHRENFGLALAEAQMCGLPVVCSDWGGFKDIVVQGSTGFRVETVITANGVRVDWRSGANAVLDLLANPALRQQMGGQAAADARCRWSIPAAAQALDRAIGDVTQPALLNSTEISEYEPTDFACRYEARKRACGWYEPADVPRTPLFQGADYALYETMMEPYATRLARKLSPDAIRPDWIPYFPAAVEYAPDCHRIRSLDPVWPHELMLTPIEWDVLCSVDGRAAVEEIARRGGDVARVRSVLRRLYCEGFLLFEQPMGRICGVT